MSRVPSIWNRTVDPVRRTVSILASCALVAGATACGGGDGSDEPDSDATGGSSGTVVAVTDNHTDLDPLEQEDVNVHTFFVEPVVIGLNYIESDYDYED